MTVDAQLALSGAEFEYFLCLEGIGWPVDEGDLSQGFAGRVFATADLNGDLATQLGCTIQMGLNTPRAISDSFDPRTNKYKHGALTFDVLEAEDDWFLGNFNPHLLNGNQGVLNAALAYDDTEPSIDNASQSWATGDLIWVAGRELIKLGTKTLDSGTVYTYPGSTRGYLGTERGRNDNRPTGDDAFKWPVSTRIDGHLRYWFDQHVILFMHVPGEAPENSIRIYNGLLRGGKTRKQGTTWSFPTTHDLVGRMRRKREGPSRQKLKSDIIIREASGRPYSPIGQVATGDGAGSSDFPAGGAPTGTFVPTKDLTSVRRRITIDYDPPVEDFERYALGYAYNYRNRVPGGTKGVITSIDADPTAPQAYQDGDSRYRLDSLCSIEGNFLRMLYTRRTETVGSAHEFRQIEAEANNFTLNNEALQYAFERGLQVKYLLDNYPNDKAANRFTVNNQVTRNPVDVLLCFLTSMNNEFFLADEIIGGFSDTIWIPGGASFTDDEWIGYAVHCVEGDNIGEARVISDNASTVTVDRAFSNDFELNKQYQIRNSIYDVLPLGWGLGVHNSRIDISAFEEVRDKYLPNAELGRFAIGEVDKFDLWDILVESICAPYGILPYIDRSTGKLTARYVGEVAVQDGLDGDYVSVAAQNILSIGDIDYMPRAPLEKIDLEVRTAWTKSIRPKMMTTDGSWAQGWLGGWSGEFEEETTAEPGVGGKTEKIQIKSDELDSVYGEQDLGSMQVKALFNSVLDAEHLAARLVSRLVREAIPYPEVDLSLDLSYLTQVQAGVLLSITANTEGQWYPVNPYTGARGWNALVARVLTTKISIGSRQPGLDCRIQLLPSIVGGRIAPAALTTSSGTDSGDEYFVVHDPGSPVYDPDNDDLDWEGFAVGDLITHYDQYGQVVDSGYEIDSFGSNRATDPTDASDGRIYITGSVATSPSAGDYLSFDDWSGSATSNMKLYAAIADSDGNLTGGDSARKYAG